MLLPVVLLCALAATLAAPAPASYDERQDGDFNVRADVKNVMLLIAVPKMGQLLSPNLLNFVLSKSAKGEAAPELQERADVQVMEAFVEPSTPYRVEIGSESDRSAEGDGRAVEVVIAGRRRASAEEPEGDEIKLLGATEQCGPDAERDPVSLTCRARAAPVQPAPPAQPADQGDAVQPEVVLASS